MRAREYGATELSFFLSVLERDLIWDFGMSGIVRRTNECGGCHNKWINLYLRLLERPIISKGIEE